MKYIKLFLLISFVLFSTNLFSNNNPVSESLNAETETECIEVAISPLPSFTYTQSQGKEYIDLSSYNNIPTEIWDRTTYPSLQVLAIKMSKKRTYLFYYLSGGSPYNPLFFIDSQKPNKVILHEDGTKYPNLNLGYGGTHKGKIGSTKYFTLNATP